MWDSTLIPSQSVSIRGRVENVTLSSSLKLGGICLPELRELLFERIANSPNAVPQYVPKVLPTTRHPECWNLKGQKWNLKRLGFWISTNQTRKSRNSIGCQKFPTCEVLFRNSCKQTPLKCG